MLDQLHFIKKVFLLDAAGALLSTLLLGVVLPYYLHLIDLPLHSLYVLATMATILFIYSFSCFLLLIKRTAFWLKLLVLLNLSYTFYTLAVLWEYRNEISHLGLLYFMVEIIILILLVVFEWKSSLK
jgi:hypothetical protein